jgi:hypothetical protein
MCVYCMCVCVCVCVCVLCAQMCVCVPCMCTGGITYYHSSHWHTEPGNSLLSSALDHSEPGEKKMGMRGVGDEMRGVRGVGVLWTQ